MIYSCTMFFNEVDLLKVKINEELRGGVDQIIIAESRCTFSGYSKPAFLANAYLPSQAHVVDVSEEMMKVPLQENVLITSFQREAIQRNAPLKDIEPNDDDVVICTDLDEIFTAQDIPIIAKAALEHGFVHLNQDSFMYKLNLWLNEQWCESFAVSGRYLRGKTLNELRVARKGFKRIDTNGKHFGYMASPSNIAYKIQSFAHIDHASNPDNRDLGKIDSKIHSHTDLFGRRLLFPVVVDETYPQTILSDMEIWKSWVEPGATITLREMKKSVAVTNTETKEHGADYANFYRIVSDPIVTFPWRKL